MRSTTLTPAYEKYGILLVLLMTLTNASATYASYDYICLSSYSESTVCYHQDAHSEWDSYSQAMVDVPAGDVCYVHGLWTQSCSWYDLPNPPPPPQTGQPPTWQSPSLSAPTIWVNFVLTRDANAVAVDLGSSAYLAPCYYDYADLSVANWHESLLGDFASEWRMGSIPTNSLPFGDNYVTINAASQAGGCGSPATTGFTISRNELHAFADNTMSVVWLTSLVDPGGTRLGGVNTTLMPRELDVHYFETEYDVPVNYVNFSRIQLLDASVTTSWDQTVPGIPLWTEQLDVSGNGFPNWSTVMQLSRGSASGAIKIANLYGQPAPSPTLAGHAEQMMFLGNSGIVISGTFSNAVQLSLRQY